jgi:hypothetical protein
MTWLASAAALLAVVAVGVFVFGGRKEAPAPRSEPATVGRLVIDAAPWAYIRQVADASGALQKVPEPAVTPVALTLPPGDYSVTLEGPAPTSTRREYLVSVSVGGRAATPVEQFVDVSPEEFLR